jgi:hypothetical protein
MVIPQIQIQQQYGKLGMETVNASQDIRQPRATFEVTTTRPQVDIKSPGGELTIDQSRAFDAVGLGGTLQVLSRIYEQSVSIAIQGVADIVQKGNQMAAIQTHQNAIADIARGEAFKESPMEYRGEASYLNVSEQYIAHKPEVNVTNGEVNVNTHPNPPEITYNPGKVNIYMLQWPKIDIIPPQIDYKA